MKNRNFILVCIVLVALSASNCKKKYPKDIPKWLKEKINTMEKDSKGKGCRYDDCRNVTEHTDGSSTFYFIADGGAPHHYYVYNYPGTLVCEYGSADGSNCYFQYDRYEKIRTIWIEN